MRKIGYLGFVLLGLGCGDMNAEKSQYIPGFEPPPAPAGNLTYISPVIRDIPPGTDITMCSYLDAYVEEDTDVIDYHVYQSRTGHHTILFAAKKPQPVGTHECTEDDMVNTRFVAASGGEGVGTLKIEEGLALRIPAKSQLMIQTHWINATPQPADGQAVAYVVPTAANGKRAVLDLFNVILTDITIPAGKQFTASTTCQIKRDLQLYTLTGHAHELGSHVSVELLETPDMPSMLWTNPWKPEYQSNPPNNMYSKAKPLLLKSGQSMRVTCSWDNTAGTKDVRFPREMCVGSGFFFPADNPIDCENGFWSE